jgi:hypothetical protein
MLRDQKVDVVRTRRCPARPATVLQVATVSFVHRHSVFVQYAFLNGARTGQPRAKEKESADATFCCAWARCWFHLVPWTCRHKHVLLNLPSRRWCASALCFFGLSVLAKSRLARNSRMTSRSARMSRHRRVDCGSAARWLFSLYVRARQDITDSMCAGSMFVSLLGVCACARTRCGGSLFPCRHSGHNSL